MRASINAQKGDLKSVADILECAKIAESADLRNDDDSADGTKINQLMQEVRAGREGCSNSPRSCQEHAKLDNRKSAIACPSYLSIRWPTFSATHIGKNQSFSFPPKIMISPWTQRRIRKILLNQDFYVLPLVEYNQNFRLLDLSTDETPRERSVIVGVAETSLF